MTLQQIYCIVFLLILIAVIIYIIYINSPERIKAEASMSQDFKDDSCVTVAVNEIPQKICLDNIVNRAKSFWKLYEKGIQVYDTFVDYAQALPCFGDKSSCEIPSQNLLENFIPISANPYLISIKSGGPDYKQLDFLCKPLWTCKGNAVIDGKKHGQYISRATIVIKHLSALLLNKVDITCSVVKVFNKGTEEKPIAAIHLFLKVIINNPEFTKNPWKYDIFLYGDGTHEMQEYKEE